MGTVEDLQEVAWSPNEAASDAKLPEIGLHIKGANFNNIEAYVKAFEGGLENLMKSPGGAGASAPSMMTFGRMNFMPDPSKPGIMPFPGLSPDSLKKIVREHVAAQMVISMRIDDVLRYSTLSSHPWMPGWRIELLAAKEHPSEAQRKEMREIETFLQTSAENLGLAEARERDGRKLTDFQRFLSAGTRDSLTFDALAIWTNSDGKGRVKAYAIMPAGNIRLMAPVNPTDAEALRTSSTSTSAGVSSVEYAPDTFAVALDDGGNVKFQFNRKQLIYYTRNPRSDPEYGTAGSGYGYPELEMAMRAVQGFQNALDLNADTFDKNTIPNGILMLTGGGWVQKQIDVLSRIWTNLKKGITKAWALPVVATPKEGKMEILDLKDLKGDDVRYQDAMNMFIGCVCTLFRFPVKRLGYRISGRGPDTQPNPDASSKIVDEDDPGLAPLLIHWENVINQYLIWSRWPDYRFVFTGKNPKESAREYEFKRNAMTLGEARAETDLVKLENLTSGDADLKWVAEAMSLCPLDPALAGIYQSLISAIAAAKFAPEPTAGAAGQPKTPGARMQGSKDPATSAAHGKTPGVRRDSAAEGKRNK